MKISIGVTAGLDKAVSEDTAFFNGMMLNSDIRSENINTILSCGIADGVGGNAGGANASQYISSEIIHTDFSAMEQADIERYVLKLNHKLISHSQQIPGKETMATTLTSVVREVDGYYLIHAGNTRLYVMQGSYLKQMTQDQTTYQWLMNMGQFESAEQCNCSEINCCLGGGNPRYAQNIMVEKIFDESFPDTIFMTSDGIHEYVDIDAMEAVINGSSSDSVAIKRITDQATQNGSTDDKTVIIVKG